MYDPTKYGKEFGSELRKRQTPEIARRKRRQALVGMAAALLFSGWLLIEAIEAIRAGKMVSSGRVGSPQITGYEAGIFALVAITLFAIGLWKTLREKDG